MSLKKSILTVLALCLPFAANAVLADTPNVPDVRADAAYVMDADTGAELYAKKADEKMYPGGTTMIMTALLGVESGKLDSVMTISDASAALDSDVSRVGVYKGDKILLRNAMTAMMTVGGCDVALDVASTVSPTQADFVGAMNTKAKEIGATNTHFVNPTGLPANGHYSTARDLSRIAAYAMKSADFRNLVNHSTYDMPYADSGSKHCVTTNEFLTSGFSGANGIKTGATNNGGPALVASATRNGHTLIATVLNSYDRSGDVEKLLSYGFSKIGETSTSAATTTDSAKASVTKAVISSEEAYVLRDAPAGQTVSDIAIAQHNKISQKNK